ncbi:hypothetical protein [Leucobacter chromiiresistens]|uniref:Uncharacterized protein n=1 Tax=Leucobacter chromiiresistens TaxID=1079994 RepID=A0A1H0ZYV7_9MICO|nr:hypothetical protein [Leucobacter chromiiresistens]SDQ32615.1 hypothetical protein SAMN04488565_2189 [Leucobacter chromiiresistens]
MLTGLLAASGISAGTVLIPAQEAQAATPGAGLYDGAGVGIGALVHSDGTIVYCLEMGKIVPEGNDAPLVPVSGVDGYSFQGWFNGYLGLSGASGSVGALSAADTSALKYILGNWGTTSNNIQAAAVQLAVWDLRSASGDAGYNATINQIKQALASKGQQGVVDQAASMIAQGRAHAAAPDAGNGGPVTQPGAPVIRATGAYRGTATTQAGSTYLTVDNAKLIAQPGVEVSADGKRATITDGAAHTIAWEGVPPEGYEFGRYYRVTFNGRFEYTVSKEGELVVSDLGGLNQKIGIGRPSTTETRSGEFEAQYVDPDTIWAPTLTSMTVTKKVKKGQKYSDVLTFAADPSIGSGIWRYQVIGGKSSYAPIKAKGTAYGPFLQDPADNPSGIVPKNAPIAATAEVTTSTEEGPNKDYAIDSNEVAQETGYVTWVWEIDARDQLPSIIAPKPVNGKTASSLPENYHFTDGYGVATESQWVPTELVFKSELSASEITVGDDYTDDLEVKLAGGGGWLQTDGKRTPATVRGTVYASDTKPKQQQTAPKGAEVLQTTKLVTDTPGQKLTSDVLSLPIDTKANYITVQWCVFDEDQSEASKGKFEETCDDYGVPSETAKVIRPEVTTQAQETGAVKGDINDVATITGGLPSASKWDLAVDFTAFLKPEAGQPKYDENWKPILDEAGKPVLWTEAEVSDPKAVCDAQPVGRTDKVAVTKLGDVKSPSIRAETEGTVYWVEQLTATPEGGGDETVMHTGECGLPNETTEIVPPKVTTQAIEKGAVRGNIHDVAKVEGPLSERPEVKYEVDFTLYLKPEAGQPKYDENWNPIVDKAGNPVLWTEAEVKNPDAVCDAQPVAHTKPVAVKGAGKVKSPAVIANSAGTTYWVEDLKVIDGDEPPESVHRGMCGLPNETTVVEEPTVHTESAGTVSVGEEMFDTAIVDGPLSDRPKVEYKVTFKAYERVEGEQMVCSADTELADFEDATGVQVTGAGSYESKKVITREEHVGLGGYVETLVRIEDGEETVVHVGKCGEESENFEITPKSVLALTGGMGMAGVAAAGTLLLVGGAALAIYQLRRRKAAAALQGGDAALNG